jgi:hypothetical protein
MAVQTEGARLGDWLKWEMDGRMSRKTVTVGAGNLVSGTVMGQIALGAATPTAFTANAANTGTCGTVTVGAGAKVGTYKVVIIEPGSNAGKFTVEDPDGITVGVGTVAAAFSGGGLGFTIADGATDFISGEGFNIDVAAGTGNYIALDKDATDGSVVAVGILVEDVDASSAAKDGVIIYQNARIDTRGLTWADAIAGTKTAALAQLQLAGIVAGELG